MKDILNLIKAGESQTIEYKRSLAESDKAIQEIVSFANADGGILFFGVADDGTMIGVEVGKISLEKLSNKITTATDPVIYPSITVENIDGKQIIVVKVNESDDKPHLAFGRPYKRVGKNTVQMKRNEYERLLKQRSNTHFDQEIVIDATLDDIDENKVKWFLEKRAQVRNVGIPNTKLEQILLNLHAVSEVDGDLVPTYSGILFFGNEPQKFLARSQLKVARFKGVTRIEFIDEARLKGTLPEMLDTAEKFIRRNTRKAQKVVGFRGTTIYEYPYQALREAIVNALVHRDYELSGSTQVMIFDDRVEVQSPGVPPGGLDIKKLEGIHRPRNDILCERFRDIDEMEEYGTGITKMKNWMKSHGLKKPELQEKADHFLITFYGPGEHILDLIPEEGETDLKAIGLNERQVKALSLMVNEGKAFTNKSYRELFDVGNKTVTRDLFLLDEKGFIKKIGLGRNTRYVAI